MTEFCKISSHAALDNRVYFRQLYISCKQLPEYGTTVVALAVRGWYSPKAGELNVATLLLSLSNFLSPKTTPSSSWYRDKLWYLCP